MSHKIQSVIALDCETGGLNCIKNAMCSVAVSSFSLFDGTEISRYETFIQPYSDLTYDDAAMKYTGITFAQLHSGLPIKEAVKELCNQFEIANTAKTHTKKPILLGHNIGFDIGFIMKAFNFCKVDISKYLSCTMDGNGNMIPSYFDTMWLSRMKWGGDESMTKYNLGVCCEKGGVALTDAHNAMNDVVSTKELFISFMNGLRSSGGIVGPGEQLIKNRPRKYFQI